MCDCGELGEFSVDFGRPDEMVDPFFEEESYANSTEEHEEDFKLPHGVCSSMIHYA